MVVNNRVIKSLLQPISAVGRKLFTESNSNNGTNTHTPDGNEEEYNYPFSQYIKSEFEFREHEQT